MILAIGMAAFPATKGFRTSNATQSCKDHLPYNHYISFPNTHAINGQRKVPKKMTHI